jgi:outer membrane protein
VSSNFLAVLEQAKSRRAFAQRLGIGLGGFILALLGVGQAAPSPTPAPVVPVLPNSAEARREPLSITLPEAIQRALARNFQIQIEQFTPQIARARQLRDSGKFDPTLQLSYTYDQRVQELRTLTSTLDVPTGVPGEPDPELFATNTGGEFDSSIAGLLPWGMTYDFGASVTSVDDSRRDFTRYDSFLGLNLTQPLLRNFGTDVNLATIRIARTNLAISQWQLQQRVIDVVTETILAYNELFFFLNNLDVELRSRELAAQLLQDNQKRAEIGVMAPLDIVQAQADLAAREERVLVADRAAKDAENLLKGLISDDVAEILAFRLSIEPPPTAMNFRPDLQKDFAAAFELRPDYREALLDLQRRNISLVFIRNQVLPRLDLIGSFGVNGIDRGLGSSIGQVVDSGDNNWAAAVGAVFSVPIPNRTARGEAQVSELEIAQALVALQRLEQAILIEADNAAGQIETTRKRIEASRAARRFAELTLEAGQSRLASGTTTTFEVLQFQRDLAQARINEVGAMVDHNRAIAEYARRTGTTLLFNQISLE